ncbi:Modification methylase MjaII [uncultured archaeon]|nr:Modification methylase MjaII [uncultured archaeon]
MILQQEMRSPKRSKDKRSSILYNYYAGFSPEFVEDVVKRLEMNSDAVIMDPWNGSGTTTQVAMRMGYSAIGFDINPVMVIVAKARLLNCTSVVRKRVLDNLESLMKMGLDLQTNRLLDDPLESWLEPESAECFRNIERSIQLLLIGTKYDVIYNTKSLSHISHMASFFYLALFRTLRKFLTTYVSSNPTWIKIPSSKRARIHPSSNEVYEELQNQVYEMIDIVNFMGMDANRDNSQIIQIERASSESIPLPNSSIDLVVSSPPYCTRIDYAIATSPELALLGCSMEGEIKNLRDHMIGTPTIINERSEIRSEWGQTCKSFLRAVEMHSSKASKSYYYKYLIQYFDAIYRSLQEINRTLVESGYCVIVVQDSYYKDIHNDLPKIFCNMADSFGWTVLDRFDFHINRTMAGRNNRIRKYRSSSMATESVLLFKKEK